MSTHYHEIYSLSDIGKSELPEHLASIKPHVKDWDSLIEGYNTALSGAERCQLKGIRGILDGYLEVSFAAPEHITESERTVFSRFWKAFDEEIIKTLAAHCKCNLH